MFSNVFSAKAPFSRSRIAITNKATHQCGNIYNNICGGRTLYRLANLPGFPGNVPGFEAVPGLPGLLKKFPVSSFERKVIPVGSFVPIS